MRSCIVYSWDHKSGASFWAGLKVCVCLFFSSDCKMWTNVMPSVPDASTRQFGGWALTRYERLVRDECCTWPLLAWKDTWRGSLWARHLISSNDRLQIQAEASDSERSRTEGQQARLHFRSLGCTLRVTNTLSSDNLSSPTKYRPSKPSLPSTRFCRKVTLT